MQIGEKSATYGESDATSEDRTLRPIPAPGIGRRIGEVADLLGTRVAAYTAMGVSSSALQRYINEENVAPFEALARLCIAAGARLEWLATGEGAIRGSETAQPRGSQSARLNAETMRAALKLLTWAFELQGASYDPARDPDLLVETYAFLDEHGGSVTPDNLVDFSRRLAEKRAQEALRGKQGGSGTVPGGSDTEPSKK